MKKIHMISLIAAATLSSCRGAAAVGAVAMRNESARDMAGVLFAAIFGSLVLAGVFYVTLSVMLDAFGNSLVSRKILIAACVVAGVDIFGGLMPDALSLLVLLGELYLIYYISNHEFRLSSGKSLGVVGICVAATVFLFALLSV